MNKYKYLINKKHRSVFCLSNYHSLSHLPLAVLKVRPEPHLISFRHLALRPDYNI